MGGERREGPYARLVGSTATVTRTVSGDDTAIALGSGDVPVLATPRLVAWLEAGTVDALAGLPPDLTSVGTRVEIEHLRASPVGADVTCTALVAATAGRLLTFEVRAREGRDDGSAPIARGRVVRAVVDRATFLARTGAR